VAFRFLHSADWHIGRIFHNVSLLDDQAQALEQLVELARDSRAQALIVAGDVYDRAVPPADAVRLLDETLRRITLDLDLALIVIAGNHDSAERLGFGSALMEERRCFIRGPLAADISPIELADTEGPVRIYPIPYAEPVLVRERLETDAAHCHDSAMGAITDRLRPHLDARIADRAIAVAHCFVTGGDPCESERPLSVGGAGNVGAARFDAFDYTALGHLHRPQALGERTHYAGSLLKYSFSEAGHRKYVNLVEIAAGGAVTVERIPLTPRRDLRIVEGRLADLLGGPAAGESADDYLLVRLTDKEALLDPMGKLRQVYPNILHLERPGLLEAGELATAGRERLKRGEQALFASFFEQVTGDPLGDAQRALLAEVIDQIHARAREADA
jgi:exonuclease SbcD